MDVGKSALTTFGLVAQMEPARAAIFFSLVALGIYWVEDTVLSRIGEPFIDHQQNLQNRFTFIWSQRKHTLLLLAFPCR